MLAWATIGFAALLLVAVGGIVADEVRARATRSPDATYLPLPHWAEMVILGLMVTAAVTSAAFAIHSVLT